MAPRKSPIAISVINMKGGVGKSTLSALLCRYASRSLGLDVLAIDLDPQANLSQAFMGPAYRTFLSEGKPSIVEIFNGYLPSSKTRQSPSSLSVEEVAVSSARLGSESLQIIPSRFDFSDNLIGALRPDPKILARCLSENFQKKDLVVIDCAPTESVLTRAASSSIMRFTTVETMVARRRGGRLGKFAPKQKRTVGTCSVNKYRIPEASRK